MVVHRDPGAQAAEAKAQFRAGNFGAAWSAWRVARLIARDEFQTDDSQIGTYLSGEALAGFMGGQASVEDCWANADMAFGIHEDALQASETRQNLENHLRSAVVLGKIVTYRALHAAQTSNPRPGVVKSEQQITRAQQIFVVAQQSLAKLGPDYVPDDPYDAKLSIELDAWAALADAFDRNRDVDRVAAAASKARNAAAKMDGKVARIARIASIANRLVTPDEGGGTRFAMHLATVPGVLRPVHLAKPVNLRDYPFGSSVRDL